MYSTDVARIIFSGTTDKYGIAQRLRDEKRDELKKLVPIKVIEKVVSEGPDRFYLSMSTCGFTITVDHAGGMLRVSCNASGTSSALIFLSKFPRIKELFCSKLEIIFGKEAINESARS